MVRDHGRAKYVHEGCTCGICNEANNQYQRDYTAGRFGTMSVAPVREHLRALMGLGWTNAELSRVSGYSPAGLYHIRTRGHRVREQTALDLLSIPLQSPDPKDARDAAA